MDRTIRVTGKGKVSVVPDMARVDITLSGIEFTYEEAIRESASRKEELNHLLSEMGMSKDKLKTISFDVNPATENYQDENKNWQKRFLGYRFNHQMKVEFPKNNELLGKVLVALVRCKGEPEFSVEFTVSDPDALKNELLKKAVEDSMEKAKVLAESAGVPLGAILSIDYSWGEINLYTRSMNSSVCYGELCSAPMEGAIPMDIEPDDINVTDTVTVVWAIKNI